LVGIKRVARIVAIVPSKRAAARKDKNAQRGEHGQQKFLPHNLTYIFIEEQKNKLLTSSYAYYCSLKEVDGYPVFLYPKFSTFIRINKIII
jgi:hypothetical protein